ncbi:MAG: 50S ribosomal protein L11 methyltransferase [Lachnospiraceae bacterium]
MDWIEVLIAVAAEDIDRAADIANMVVPYGIYIEDYRNLEAETWEIANIDLIDEELLGKDRSKGYIHIYIAPEENPQEAVAFLSERFTASAIGHKIDLSACKNEDWENNWKAYFKPMPVGEKLLIQPLWIDEIDNPENRAVLSIEPGLAFGTGGHHTTKLCLETLERYVKAGDAVLDTGCGSGILAIASLLFGAESAVGVDIDELAVKTAVENGKLNGFTEPQYRILQGNLADKVEGLYSVVVANIVADVIMLFAKDVGRFMREDAVFITSGIIDTREAEVQAALRENGFAVTERNEQSGWVCLVCKKQ